MSCSESPDSRGGAATGDCSEVLHDVWQFLDDELNPERRAAIQQHLDDCSPCLEEAGIDTKLKALLARKCGGDHAPEGLRERIAARLVTRRTQVGSDGSISSSITASSLTVDWES